MKPAGDLRDKVQVDDAPAERGYDAAKKTYAMRSYAQGRAGDFPLQVRADGFDWQIPGLRDELVTAHCPRRNVVNDRRVPAMVLAVLSELRTMRRPARNASSAAGRPSLPFSRASCRTPSRTGCPAGSRTRTSA